MSAQCFCFGKRCRGKELTIRTLETHLASDMELFASYTQFAPPNGLVNAIEHMEKVVEALKAKRRRTQPAQPQKSPDYALSLDSADDYHSMEHAVPIADANQSQSNLQARETGSMIEDVIGSANELSESWSADNNPSEEEPVISQVLQDLPDESALYKLLPFPAHDHENMVEDDDLEQNEYTSADAEESHRPTTPAAESTSLLQELRVPECLRTLQRHRPSIKPTSPPPAIPELDSDQTRTLRVRYSNFKNRSTVKAYSDSVTTHQAEGQSVDTLYNADKLLSRLAPLEEKAYDQCPVGCLSYTGKHADKKECDALRTETTTTEVNGQQKKVRKQKQCGVSRYKNNGKPAAQWIYIPFIPRLQKMFQVPWLSELMRSFHNAYQKSKADRQQDHFEFSDFPTCNNFHDLSESQPELIEDSRHCFFACTTDGAKLSIDRRGDFWLISLLLLNIPAEQGRYRQKFQFTVALIHGLLGPVDLESYFGVLFDEFFKAAAGVWTWDGYRKEWFLLKAWLLVMLADHVGALKIIGMSGMRGKCGCIFCKIVGARANASSRHYFPLLNISFTITKPKSKEKTVLNQGRPNYNPGNLPLRTLEEYFQSLDRLHAFIESSQNKKITQLQAETGVMSIPEIAKQPLFSHPAFNPPDIAHLAAENVVPQQYDIWVAEYISKSKLQQIGIAIEHNKLPSSFSANSPRNIDLKRNTQYKMWEWFAWLFFYSLPLLEDAGLAMPLLENWAIFVAIMTKISATPSLTQADISILRQLAEAHQRGFEEIYVNGKGSQLTRCTLMIHSILHLADAYEWHGNPFLYSQFACERQIGEAKLDAKSKRLPFQNMVNRALKRQQFLILGNLYPHLFAIYDKAAAPTTLHRFASPLGKRQLYSDKFFENQHTSLQIYLQSFGIAPFHSTEIRKALKSSNHFSKCYLPSLEYAGSLRGENITERARSARYCRGQTTEGEYFCEVISFLEYIGEGEPLKLAFIRKFRPAASIFASSTYQILHQLALWVPSQSYSYATVSVQELTEVIGILQTPNHRDRLYILRRNKVIATLTDLEVTESTKEAETEGDAVS